MRYEKLLMALIMLGAVALFLMVGNAFAGEATVTWTHPTTRTDGSALPASQIGSTKVEWGTCQGSSFGTAAGNASAAGAATSLVVPNLPAGTYCFRAATIDTGGLQSGWSAVVSKVVPVAPPNPPTLVTISTYAYEFRPRLIGGFKLVRVADVKQGVPCSEIPGLAGSGFGIADGKVAICGEG
jgi:hypothetical protein